MKLLGTMALVALLLITLSDGKRLKRKRTSVVEDVAELKAKVEKLTAQVHELQEQSHGVHIHIEGDHHEHHDHHDTDHDTDDHNNHGSGSHDDDSDSTDNTDSTSSTGSDTHDDHHHDENHHDNQHHDNGHHHNEHHHIHNHQHNGHSDNHYPHAHEVYVNMKLDGGCSHDDKHTTKAHHEEQEIHAHCEMMPNMQTTDLTYKIRGHVKLTQKLHEDEISIRYALRNLKPSVSHAIHIHESGDMERCCESLGGHYNPHGKQHGLPHTQESHVGDLGNIAGDDQGHYGGEQTIHADIHQLIGRAFVIHKDSDTGEGSQGDRLACCVIGRAHEDHQDGQHGHDDHHDHHEHDDHHDHHDQHEHDDHHGHDDHNDHHDHHGQDDHHDHHGHDDHGDEDEHHENQDNSDQQDNTDQQG